MAMLGRVGMNLLLAYGAAGLTMLLAVVLHEVIDRPVFGPGIAGEWAVGMGTLLFGAPVVLMVLVAVDYFLKGTRRMRRAAFLAAIVPAALSALLMPVYPEIVAVTVWLLVTGLMFGAVMRLPIRRALRRP